MDSTNINVGGRGSGPGGISIISSRPDSSSFVAVSNGRIDITNRSTGLTESFGGGSNSFTGVQGRDGNYSQIPLGSREDGINVSVGGIRVSINNRRP